MLQIYNMSYECVNVYMN